MLRNNPLLKFCPMKLLFAGIAACGLLATASPAHASIITGAMTYTGEKGSFSGTGNGSIFNVLVLQHDGSEYGSVQWNGANDVYSVGGNESTGGSQTQTQPLSNLTDNSKGFGSSFDFHNLVMVFQVNNTGNGTLDLHTFDVTIQDKDGNTLADFTFTPGGSNTSTNGLGGVGQGSSGYIFRFDTSGLTSSQFNSLFGTSTNRIGMIVTSGNAIDNTTSDGPVKPVAEAHLKKLIVDLESDVYAVRQKALLELEAAHDAAGPALTDALKGKLTLEGKLRVESLLGKIKSPLSNPAELQFTRALEVLERIGTEPAREVLAEIAKGVPHARRTQQAQACLDRCKALQKS